MYTLFLLTVFGHDIDNLSADEFQVREQAEARLARNAVLVWPLLDRKFPCPEKNRRARRVVDKVLPASPPPIALLTGDPLAEWCYYGEYVGHIGPRPGPEWRLGWLCPDRKVFSCVLVCVYGERTRTQCSWPLWHMDADGRAATRLLCRDLLALGVPPQGVWWLVEYLERKEKALEVPRMNGIRE